MKHSTRRSFLSVFGAISGGIAMGSFSFFQVFSKSQLNTKYAIAFTYTGKDKEAIDAYIQQIMTPEFLDFKKYWMNTKNVEKFTKRTNNGSTLISTHVFLTESDLKAFWEAAKYIPGKAEREALGISREYKIFKIEA